MYKPSARALTLLFCCAVLLGGNANADIVTDWNRTTLMLNPAQGSLRGG